MKYIKDADELLVAPVMRAVEHVDGRIGLTRKFIDGMAAYAALWPGRVTTLMDKAEARNSNLDQVAVSPADLSFGVEWLPQDPADRARRLSQAKVMLATLDASLLQWLAVSRRTGTPIVWVTEYSVSTRRQIIDAVVPGFLRRQKRKLDTTWLERRFRSAISRAAGVQCNGTPTYETYRHLNPHGLLFFDSRVDARMMATADDITARSRALLAGAPLRLAFSGRLIAMKGVDHLPLVAAELRRRGIPFSFDIYGGGDREPALRAAINRLDLGDSLRLRGVLDFESELVPTVKTQVDLFVCCHPQGDPSCTYLETMSCGTPIAGYDNEAWRGLADMARTGWVTPMGKPAELAETIALLHADRPALVRAAYVARDFSRAHDFDSTMRARIDHLHACAVTARQM